MGYIGESCALLAAISFVSASTLFSKSVKSCSLLLLNLIKCIVSLVLNFLVLSIFSNAVFPEDSFRNYTLQSLSGILGIAVGDTFYLKSLDNIGARQTILLETLAPTFTGFISYFYFGTTLNLQGWAGIIFTCIGIYIVVNEQSSPSSKEVKSDLELGTELVSLDDQSLQVEINSSQEVEQESSKPSQQSKKIIGILCSVGYTICQAFGMVLSFDGMSSGKFSPSQSALVRVSASAFVISLFFLIKKRERLYIPCQTREEFITFSSAIILNSFVGIWAQQMAIAYTKPEIAQTIMATTPLFSLAISWYQGEVMKLKYFVGSAIAIIGVALIVWS